MLRIVLRSMGGGAITAVLLLPQLRKALTRDSLVWSGALLHALATYIVALSDNLALSMAAMTLAGMAWMTTANP